ncbi:MAG TPA: ABC transporter ATP-binding protein [Aquella sp.]|nr:ABC transporter ATP-binding protein [Aquella sp.]
MSKKVKNVLKSRKRDKPKRDEFWALKDVSFEVNPGDRLGIIGRNGAGKSTLLKILSRITEPTKGRISIKGRVASLLEVGTGFHPELTGRENIFLNGAILGMARTEIRKKFDEIVAFAEVERFLDTPVKRYSSGMYVRLAFAVAAHLEPEILVVDEVLAVGDAQFQKKCLGKMEEVSRNEGRTVLFVSHNMGVVTQLCSSSILLQNGQIAYMGLPKHAIEKYLGSQNISNEYRLESEQKNQKINFVDHLIVKNERNESVSNFSFDEKIVLHFLCRINDYSPNLQIGIAMLDKLNNRVFTVLKEIDYFMTSEQKVLEGNVGFPDHLFAPSNYTFSFAIWTKDGIIHDLVENICAISIHDNGTELAQYENTDYGCVIVSPQWNKYV